jgi:ATP-dependent Lhr-like helicase
MLQQAFNEVLELQLDEARMRAALKRINSQQIVLKHMKKSSPFAFPIMVDRLNRDRVSSEKLEDRIRKMIAQLEK